MGEALKIGITGLPGAGKTYCLLKVIEMLEADGLKVGGMITEPIVKRNRREGFYVMDWATKEKRVFASREITSKTMVGRFGVDISALEEVGVNALRSATANADVLVIDEVGKMEVNATMAVNRDLSAIGRSKWPRPLGSLLDGGAATGAWGIRMALEVGAEHLALNDRSRDATQLIRENLHRTGLIADVRTGDLSAYLGERRYDFVDIDPFGPPAPFLGAAFGAAKESSGIGITATDTAVLCGTYPNACVKRYGARPLRSAQGAEIGLRILLGYCHRLAAQRGSQIQPIFAFSAEHFLRIYVLVESGSGSGSIGHLVRVGPGRFIVASGADRATIGPLWLGPLGDPAGPPPASAPGLTARWVPPPPFVPQAGCGDAPFLGHTGR